MSIRRSTNVDILVGEKIRTFRKLKGFSQSELAKEVGVTFQQVQKYEKGVNRVGAGRLYELARVFQIPIHALFPTSEEAVKTSDRQAEEAQALSDFVSSADGWLLCRSFMRITDPKRRKRIIGLVRQIVEETDAET